MDNSQYNINYRAQPFAQNNPAYNKYSAENYPPGSVAQNQNTMYLPSYSPHPTVQSPNQMYPPGIYPPNPTVQSPNQIYPPGIYPPDPAVHNFSHRDPVINQPTLNQIGVPSNEWISIPQEEINCPPGLEYLSMIDQLLIHQKVELLEAFTGFETQNQYSVKNSLGQKIYHAGEDSGCCTRNCCGPIRPFEMKIFDNLKNEVMSFYRPFACDSCWCPCWLQVLEVCAPPGTVIGTVEQKWSIFCPKFVIKDASGETVLRIDGPFCTQSCCCGDVEFQVMSADGNTQVGKISKQWTGLVKETFTDADNFGISFPIDLDVRIKAILLGACFLIDFMFFERTREKHDRVGMF